MPKPEFITRNDIKILVSVIAVVLTIALSWYDLKSAAMSAKDAAADAKQEAIVAKEKAEDTADKQNQIALDVREIKTILRDKGLSKAPAPSFVAMAAPRMAAITPSPTPIVYHTIFETRVAGDSATPTPTLAQTPTPIPTPTPILCLLGICVGS